MRLDEAQHDVRELRLHGVHGALVGVDAGQAPQKDPRLSILARVQHVVQSGRQLQERRRGGPAVLGRDVVSMLRPGLLQQDGVSPSVLSPGHKKLLIDCGEDLLSNDLLLSSSAPLFWRSSSHSDDVWSPEKWFSVSVRSPFMPSTSTPRSPRRRCVSIGGRQHDNLILLHLDEWRMVGLAVLFVRFQGIGEIKGHVILQRLKANDLAALSHKTAGSALV